MKVELLRIADCPNVEAAKRLLKETLCELELSAEIREIEVADDAGAEALRFPGSPTIRIDDIDVETSPAEQNSYGLFCRTYIVRGKLRGLPTHEMIRKAIRLAVSVHGKEARR